MPRRLGAALALACTLAACRGEPPPPPPPDFIPTDDLIYEHPAAGFTLAFPPSWHGRYDVDARSGPIAAGRWPLAEHAVAFRYKPVEPDLAEAPLLTVLVYRRDGWSAISAEPGPPVGVVVAERGDDVYVASLPQSNPYPPGSRDGEYFDGMRLTAEQVKESLAPH